MKNNDMVHRIISAPRDIVRGVTFKLGGQEADAHNNAIIHDCIEHWMLLPLEAVRVEASEVAVRERLCNFVSVLVRDDFSDVLRALEIAYRSLITGRLSRYSEFKAHISLLGVDPLLLSPIVSDLNQWFSSHNHFYLARAVQFIRYPAKLSFEMKSLQEAALDSYLTSETRLSSLDLSENTDLIGVRHIIEEWLTDFEIRNLPVRHGPGSVAEGHRSKVEKYFGLRVDTRISYVITRLSKLGVSPESYYPFGLDTKRVSSRTAKVVFVPKNATKLRTICMEPTTLQYFQQGVMRCLSRHFRAEPTIRKHVTLEDQEPNQVFARIGSLPEDHPQYAGRESEYATIDLSAASDSVSWDLVKSLFRRTSLYPWLLATRSTHSKLPNGTTISSIKFAPMGSALCFPVECLIFAACTELVVREHYRTSGRGIRLDYRVYGDDIAVPALVYPRLAALLESFGFLVNFDKSYWAGPFRESCGKEYYEGYDITPLYHRTSPVVGMISSTDFMAVCGSANNALLHGLTFLRSKHICTLLETRKDSGKLNLSRSGPLFGATLDRSPVLWSWDPSNFHLEKRWNRDFQIREFRHISVCSTGEKKVHQLIEDQINYFETLVSYDWNPDRIPDETNLILSRLVVPRTPSFCRSWTAQRETQLD